MGKSLPLHIPDDLEEMINIVLRYTDDYETEQQLIRTSVKKQLKENYPELLIDKLKKNERQEE